MTATLVVACVIGWVMALLLISGAWQVIQEQGRTIKDLQNDNRRLVNALGIDNGKFVGLHVEAKPIADKVDGVAVGQKKQAPYWQSKQPTFQEKPIS